VFSAKKINARKRKRNSRFSPDIFTNLSSPESLKQKGCQWVVILIIVLIEGKMARMLFRNQLLGVGFESWQLNRMRGMREAGARWKSARCMKLPHKRVTVEMPEIKDLTAEGYRLMAGTAPGKPAFNQALPESNRQGISIRQTRPRTTRQPVSHTSSRIRYKKKQKHHIHFSISENTVGLFSADSVWVNRFIRNFSL